MDILKVEKEILEFQNKNHVDIRSGDVVTVTEKIIDSAKTRIQKFQGIVISVKGQNHKKNILLRKKFQSWWLEKKFFLNSPLVESVVVDNKGTSRRAVLNFLRNTKNLSKNLKRLNKSTYKKTNNTQHNKSPAVKKK